MLANASLQVARLWDFDFLRQHLHHTQEFSGNLRVELFSEVTKSSPNQNDGSDTAKQGASSGSSDVAQQGATSEIAEVQDTADETGKASDNEDAKKGHGML